MTSSAVSVRVLMFGLSEDLEVELIEPLEAICEDVQRVSATGGPNAFQTVADSFAEVIFCIADALTVTRLRTAKPDAPIIVVTRHSDVPNWLDSIEAGASDYCTAPFEVSSLKWLLQSSLPAAQSAV